MKDTRQQTVSIDPQTVRIPQVKRVSFEFRAFCFNDYDSCAIFSFYIFVVCSFVGRCALIFFYLCTFCSWIEVFLQPILDCFICFILFGFLRFLMEFSEFHALFTKVTVPYVNSFKFCNRFFATFYFFFLLSAFSYLLRLT